MSEVEAVVMLISSLLAAASALACARVVGVFWRHRDEPIARGLVVFFAAASVAFAWLMVLDLLTLTLDAPAIHRGPWRALPFRLLVAGAAWYLVRRLARLDRGAR